MNGLKKQIEDLKLNKFTLIAAAAVLVAAIVLAIVAGVVEGGLNLWHVAPWLSALLGVLACGEGLVLYLHYFYAKSSALCKWLGICLLVIGCFWAVVEGVGFAKWWIGLISAVAIGLITYFVPFIIEKYLNK